MMRSEYGSVSRERTWREIIVIAVLFLSTAINYLDRQTLSMVAPLLRDQLSISAIGYLRIIATFIVGYMISQALAGKLIDRVGTRLGMLLCVGVWSAAAMLHGLALGVLSFCAVRFLLGIAQSGNWPRAVKAVSENFPPQRSAFAVGIFNSGSSLGAIFAPPLVVAIVELWGLALYVCGSRHHRFHLDAVLVQIVSTAIYTQRPGSQRRAREYGRLK